MTEKREDEKHSPLPWSIERGGSPQHPLDSGHLVAADDTHIAGFSSDEGDFHYDDPNYQFILRAVNNHESLLAALKTCYDWFVSECAASPDSGDLVEQSVEPVFNTICNAIANATKGGAP